MKLFGFVGSKVQGNKAGKKTKGKSIRKAVSVKNYSVEQKLKILQEYESTQRHIGLAQFCKWWGISEGSLKEWQSRYKSEGEARPRSKSKPKVPEAIKEKIIELKQKDPQVGSQRIADYLE